MGCTCQRFVGRDPPPASGGGHLSRTSGTPHEHQRPSQDVQFDQLVVAHHRLVDPNVRNVNAAKASAMSSLTRYTPPNSAAVSTAPAKTHLHLHLMDDQVPRDGGT
jgi:hypothetical protein